MSCAQLLALNLINIYIILAGGELMSVFSSSDVKNIQMNLHVAGMKLIYISAEVFKSVKDEVLQSH